MMLFELQDAVHFSTRGLSGPLIEGLLGLIEECANNALRSDDLASMPKAPGHMSRRELFTAQNSTAELHAYWQF